MLRITTYKVKSLIFRAVFLLALALAVPAEAETFSQQKAIQEISAAASSIKSLQCNFTQTKTLSLLSDKMVSQGRMLFSQPDKLRWEYTSPYTYTFIINGDKVQIVKGERSNVIDVNQNKMFKEIARIMMSSVLGTCLTDSKDFTVTVTKSGQTYLATLVPLKKELKQMFTKIQLHYDIAQKMVTRVEMYEKNGDTTVIVLKDIKKNIAIDASNFTIK